LIHSCRSIFLSFLFRLDILGGDQKIKMSVWFIICLAVFYYLWLILTQVIINHSYPQKNNNLLIIQFYRLSIFHYEYNIRSENWALSWFPVVSYHIKRVLFISFRQTSGLLRIIRCSLYPGGQAVYTTHIPVGYLPRAVVSLHARHGQLVWPDFLRLDCSFIGCSP